MYVSLWVGRFASEDALEAFIDSGAFEREQGVTIEPPLLPFHAFDDGVTPGELVAMLVRERNILARAIERLPARRINAVIRYEVRCAPARRKRTRMTFVGCFRA